MPVKSWAHRSPLTPEPLGSGALGSHFVKNNQRGLACPANKTSVLSTQHLHLGLGECSDYLFLSNTLLQSLVAENNSNFIIYHNFIDQEFGQFCSTWQ